jgi:hypothetical protein
MDYRRLFRRDSRRNYRRFVERMPDTCPSARIPTVNTDGITDGPRMHATCLSARIPMEFSTVNTDDITDGPRMPDTCPSARIPMELPTERKSLAGFLIFFVRISINFRRNYQRKLSYIYAPPPRAPHFLLSSPLLSSPPFLFSSLALLLFSLSLLIYI